MRTILFISFCIACLTSCAQTASTIKVDKSITNEVDQLIVNNQILLGYKEEDTLTVETFAGDEYLFSIKKTYDYQKFKKNDASDINYFLDSQELSKKEYTPCIGYCFMRGDTIILLGGMGYAGGLFIETKIFGNKSYSSIILSSTANVYSKNNNKSKLTNELSIRSAKQDLILTENPNYKLGDKIKGKAQIKCEPFYHLDKNGKLSKLKTEFKIVFNCVIGEEPVF